MKIKMWCLINKRKNTVIKVWVHSVWVVGFYTKKALLEQIDKIVEYDEEIRKIELQI